LHLPLVFDPGERWEYGINIDWVGRAVEAVAGQPLDAYFSAHIFAPLGMTDTSFVPSADQASRLVRVHRREPNGGLEPITMEMSHHEFFSGGGGLLSTGRDYLAFLQMLLHRGRFNGAELLRPETVSQIGQNQIGDIPLGIMKTAMPELSNDVDLFPGVRCGHGLASVINAQRGPNGRSAGTLTWAGLFNSYYWLDPQKRVAGVILTQILPFADHNAVKLYGEFESAVYDALKAA
jgi:CubicO group peptidase (beta-lactamase class C family)